MDLSVAIIGIVLLAMFIVPIIILANTNKRKEKARFDRLNFYFTKESLKMMEYDSWGNYSIGIDTKYEKIIYLMSWKVETYVEIIDLKKIKKCEISNSARNVDTKSGNELISDIIGLNIIHKDPETKNLFLEFFNSERNSQLDNELVNAKKWSGLINKHLDTGNSIPRYKKAG